MTILGRIHVERFKSLYDVDVELGHVNVFIGANGSGKSNLLEAIGVIGAAAFGSVDDQALLRRGVRPGVPRIYKSRFPRADRIHRFGSRRLETRLEQSAPSTSSESATRERHRDRTGPS
jgi:predicted ATPase